MAAAFHSPLVASPRSDAPARTVPAATRPAVVTLRDGKLTVEANNSDLAQILQTISAQTGMTVEGPALPDRVFGSYGPSDPSTVLGQLLQGLGYDIMMSGRGRDGAPNRLVLSPRSGGPLQPTNGGVVLASGSGQPAVAAPTITANAVLPRTISNAQAQAPEPEAELGPGAIAHPRPEPTVDNPQERANQNMQRLQRMHQAQEN